MNEPLVSREEWWVYAERIINQDRDDAAAYQFLLNALRRQMILIPNDLGPVLGVLAGYAHNALGYSWGLREWIFRSIAWWSLADWPAYNDFLMAFGMCCNYEESIVRRILRRREHRIGSIATTAEWMVRSVCDENPLFRAMVDRLEWRRRDPFKCIHCGREQSGSIGADGVLAVGWTPAGGDVSGWICPMCSPDGVAK